MVENVSFSVSSDLKKERPTSREPVERSSKVVKHCDLYTPLAGGPGRPCICKKYTFQWQPMVIPFFLVTRVPLRDMEKNPFIFYKPNYIYVSDIPL